MKKDHVLKAQPIYLYSNKFKNIEDDFEAAEDGMEGNGVHLNGRNTRRYVIDWIEILVIISCFSFG